MGKLRNEDLAEILRCIRRTKEVIVPPLPGFDSGVHEIDSRRLLVISTDPCIGVPEKWFGWLLINYAASDVALFGATPQFCSVNLLGPSGTELQTFQKIMREVCAAADEHGLVIITGHTGSYEGLTTMLGVCTTYGIIDKKRLVTPAGAKPGDIILCVKPFGLETTVNFSLTHEREAKEIFGSRRTVELRKLVTMQSCVKEALLLARTGVVHAMHDTTEGGLIVALNELAEASKVGFCVEFEKIPAIQETLKLKSRFRLSDEQMMAMSSTGTFLACVPPEAESRIRRKLRKNGIEMAAIGVMSEDDRRIMFKNGKISEFPDLAEDPYANIMAAKELG